MTNDNAILREDLDRLSYCCAYSDRLIDIAVDLLERIRYIVEDDEIIK